MKLEEIIKKLKKIVNEQNSFLLNGGAINSEHFQTLRKKEKKLINNLMQLNFNT